MFMNLHYISDINLCVLKAKVWILLLYSECTYTLGISLVDFHLHELAGAGETSCPPRARHDYCEDCKVRGSKGSRPGKGVEAPQRRKCLS